MKLISTINFKNEFYVKSRIKNKEHLILKIIREIKKQNNVSINVENYINYFKDIIGIRIIYVNQEDKITFLKIFKKDYDQCN